MADGLLYLDASALVKLVRAKLESDALLRELDGWHEQLTSVVAEVEVRRLAWRARVLERADAVLAELSLVELDEPVRRLAGRVGPSLRSLDAIHLASALSLGNDLGGFCCYDRRLNAEAAAAGLPIVAPGLD